MANMDYPGPCPNCHNNGSCGVVQNEDNNRDQAAEEQK